LDITAEILQIEGLETKVIKEMKQRVLLTTKKEGFLMKRKSLGKQMRRPLSEIHALKKYRKKGAWAEYFRFTLTAIM
jgi:hypothetical protein